MEISELSGITELKMRLNTHPLYGSLKTLDDLRCFMEHHVFPVWDFMSLLKQLQSTLAPSSVPWLPGNAQQTLVQRFINEIVLGEESDEGLPDEFGNPTYVSHFNLYLGAMEEVGADTRAVRAFLKAVKKHGATEAIKHAKIPEPSRRFIATTFGFLATGKPHVVAAAFALGREHVIPAMFRALLTDIGISKKEAPLFHYYLERHIHLDDEFHGPMSLRLLEQLCGNNTNKRRTVEKTACQAFEARIELWDGVLAVLPSSSKKRNKV